MSVFGPPEALEAALKVIRLGVTRLHGIHSKKLKAPGAERGTIHRLRPGARAGFGWGRSGFGPVAESAVLDNVVPSKYTRHRRDGQDYVKIPDVPRKD